MINIEKYYSNFKNDFNNYLEDNNLVIFDFDHTLGKQENTNIYIKYIIKEKDTTLLKNILEENEIVTFKKIVNNSKNIKDIKKSEEISLIDIKNNFIEDIDFLKNENNYYKYITNFNLEEFLQILPNIKEALTTFENNYTLSIINQNNKEYLSIDEIIKKQPTNIRLDISCFSKDDIELFKEIKTKNTYTKKITMIKPKDFKEEMINLNKIETKEQIDIEKVFKILEIGENPLKDCDTLELIVKYDSISFNNFKDGPNVLSADYSDFRSAKLFTENTKIFSDVKKRLIKHYNKGDCCLLLTARAKLSTFNNDKIKDDILSKDMIMKSLKKEDIEIGHIKDKKIHFFFSGYFDTETNLNINHISIQDVVKKKLLFINAILEDKDNNVNKLVIYEDNVNMIKSINQFVKEFYPKVKIDLFLVKNEKAKSFKIKDEKKISEISYLKN